MLVQALAGSSVDSHVGTRKLDLLKMWIAEVLAHTFTGSSVVKHSLVQEPALMGHHGHGAISSPGLFTDQPSASRCFFVEDMGNGAN